MESPPSIETPRLTLQSLSLELLRAFAAGEHAEVCARADFTVSDCCSIYRRPWLQRRIGMIEEDPTQHEWLNRAVVRKSDRQLIGNISFHHKAPDPYLLDYADHAAELGYTIESPFRRQGYATEAAGAMMRWAHQEHGVARYCVSISPDNEPSLRMAEAMGFKRVGEHMDEVDGLEWVMLREIS